MERDVIWIGGPTGAGKSTVAHLLAARHDRRLVRIDDFWSPTPRGSERAG